MLASMKQTFTSVICCILLFCSKSGFGQTSPKSTGFIGLGFDSYAETNKPFSFKQEDAADFRFPKGYSFSLVYRYFLGEKAGLALKFGYGIFKPHDYSENGISKSYSAEIIPVTLNGDFRILQWRKISLYPTVGAGIQFADIHINDQASNTQTNSSNRFFTYSYGIKIGYMIHPGINLTVMSGVTNFDGKMFMTYSFVVPVYLIKTKE